MIGKGPKHILISEILGQETFKWYFKMKTLVSKWVLIRIQMSLSVAIRISHVNKNFSNWQK